MTCAPKKCGAEGPKIFDVGTSVPPTCLFWNFGEKNCDPVPIQIKPTLFRRWDQLLTHLASKVGCGGGVRALFSPTGHKYTDFAELTEGLDVVVVASGYKFDKSWLPVKLIAKEQSNGAAPAK